jgi:hypothetical protein
MRPGLRLQALEVVVHPLALPLLLALQTPVDAAPPAAPAATPTTPWTLWGSIEGYGQWNLNTPDNGVTNYRAFDNRHATLTLKNAMLGVTFDVDNVVGALTGQVGATGATYYAAEPALAGASGANASSAALWQFVQQANLGYRLPFCRKAKRRSVSSPICPPGPPTTCSRARYQVTASRSTSRSRRTAASLRARGTSGSSM